MSWPSPDLRENVAELESKVAVRGVRWGLAQAHKDGRRRVARHGPLQKADEVIQVRLEADGSLSLFLRGDEGTRALRQHGEGVSRAKLVPAQAFYRSHIGKASSQRMA